MQIEEIKFGNTYHIFNRGNNSQDIFFEEENYIYFLKLLAKYILPIADLYCYCLMKNHFHFLVRIKEYDEIVESELTYSTVEKPKKIDPSRQFSHFFNAYTLAINKRFNRSGSLLEKPFERKLIKDENYFKNLIVDIHNSPKNKGIVNEVESYRWSSYARLISNSPTKLQREKVLNYFDGVENFIFCHQQPFQPSEG